MDTGHRAFSGKKPNLIFMKGGGGCWKAGPHVIDRQFWRTPGWKKTALNQLTGWESAACVHAGPQHPCIWKIEHRDTLYCSFNSEKKRCYVLLHFHILSLSCRCCYWRSLCVKISKRSECVLNLVVFYVALWELQRCLLDLRHVTGLKGHTGFSILDTVWWSVCSASPLVLNIFI